jgi:hypothetical protein
VLTREHIEAALALPTDNPTDNTDDSTADAQAEPALTS